MKRAIGVLALLAGIGAAGAWLLWSQASAPGAVGRGAQERLVPGEALVQFKAGVPESQARQLIARAGATVKERIDPQRIYVVSFPETVPPLEMVQRLKALPQVAHAEPNGITEALGLQDLWEAQAWAAPPSEAIGAGAKVRVAVIDTAIDGNHPTLSSRMVSGYNFVDNSSNTQSSGAGKDWHGTASAGRVLDGSGGANVEIMPVTVLSSGGSGSWSNVIHGINYAVDNGAQVINLSLGGTGYSALMQQAIDRAVGKGVAVVAAAGNTGQDQAFYPAAYKGVISVAATNEGGRKAGFSTYHDSVDLSAPGDTQKLLSHGGYRESKGTSFAAPFIAGMVGLLKSAFPSLTPNQVEQTLKAKANSVEERNGDAHKGKLGAGFLNMESVKQWVADIRAGRFRFPWQAAPAAAPLLQPQPVVPVQPAQNWLVRGQGKSGVYLLTPEGEVVRE